MYALSPGRLLAAGFLLLLCIHLCLDFDDSFYYGLDMIVFWSSVNNHFPFCRTTT